MFCFRGEQCRPRLVGAAGFQVGLAGSYRMFSHDVTEAILVSQNNETAAMLVFQTNPEEVEPFSYTNAFFAPINLHRCWLSE